MKNSLKAFVLGYASTLIFHQGLVVYLHTIGFLPRLPYSLTPTAPFQIPQVISLAFWGGVWGVKFTHRKVIQREIQMLVSGSMTKFG